MGKYLSIQLEGIKLFVRRIVSQMICQVAIIITKDGITIQAICQIRPSRTLCAA